MPFDDGIRPIFWKPKHALRSQDPLPSDRGAAVNPCSLTGSISPTDVSRAERGNREEV